MTDQNVWIDWMLTEQRRLQEHINGKPLADFTDEERMDALRTNVLALIKELGEALDETGWKPWATSNHLNRESFHGEMVDTWHFFMNLMLHSGMTATDLIGGYRRKLERNWERYRNHDYDGITGKCPMCKRDYNDPGVGCQPAVPGSLRPLGWCAVNTSAVHNNRVPLGHPFLEGEAGRCKVIVGKGDSLTDYAECGRSREDHG